MNHNRWHYIREVGASYLDKLGYYGLRTYLHENITKKLSKPDLQGWFSPANQAALKNTLEICCSEINSPKILEIGSWKGLSTSVIADYVRGKNGHVFCVDSWQGNEEVGAFHKTAQYRDILSVFRRNMHLLGHTKYVHALVGKSTEILPLLKDGEFDLVFVDADHRLTPFLGDLTQSLRLVKRGGYICGDDCDEKYDETRLPFYTANAEKDFQDGVHCGVVLGLHKTIGFDKVELIKGSSFWRHKV